MNWNKWMRLSHRWLSVAFTVPKPSSPYPNPPSPSYAAKCPRSTGSCGTGTLACARRLSAAISAQVRVPVPRKLPVLDFFRRLFSLCAVP